MQYYHNENEQSITTQKNMDESHYHIVDQKKPKQKSLYCIIPFIKAQNWQNKSMLLEVNIVVIFGISDRREA